MINFLNPQKWLGQIVVLIAFSCIGASLGFMYKDKINPCPVCPPQIQYNYDQKIKAKKSSSVTTETNQDCEQWLKGLSNKDIRTIKKQ